MKSGKIKMTVFCVSFEMYSNDSNVNRTHPKAFTGPEVQGSTVNDEPKSGFILCIEITNGYHIVFGTVNA